MSTPSDFEQTAHARLAREVELIKAQAAKRLREQNAALMSAEQWGRVYGRPVPGSSRTMAEVAAAAQLNARGPIHGQVGGAEIASGPEPKGWR